jgi:hypothetical protein
MVIGKKQSLLTSSPTWNKVKMMRAEKQRVKFIGWKASNGMGKAMNF